MTWLFLRGLPSHSFWHRTDVQRAEFEPPSIDIVYYNHAPSPIRTGTDREIRAKPESNWGGMDSIRSQDIRALETTFLLLKMTPNVDLPPHFWNPGSTTDYRPMKINIIYWLGLLAVYGRSTWRYWCRQKNIIKVKARPVFHCRPICDLTSKNMDQIL